jgi:molybdate transport repressor ModE-like protein
VEFRHLATLRAIADTESFREAARELGYSQSAISQQVAKLEQVTGLRLVERSRGSRQLMLTDAGQVLVQHARIILNRVAATRADLKAISSGGTGRLRIGAFQSVGAQILPRLVTEFRMAWPRVDLRLEESNDDETLWHLVERGDLDAAFSVAPVRDGPFQVRELMREPFVLLVPRSYPLAHRRAATLDDLADLSLIGLKNCRDTAALESSLLRAGADLHILLRSAENETVRSMVAHGVGAALVPALVADPSDPRVAILSLAFETVSRVVIMVWHRDRLVPAHARAITDIAASICAALAQPPNGVGGRSTT